MANSYKYYNAVIRYVTQLKDKKTKDGQPKKLFTKQEYLVNSTSISNAEKLLKSLLSAVYDVFEIISIKQSNICGVVNQIENLFTKKQEN